MRFDRFTSALALFHFAEAFRALFDPEGSAPFCRGQKCNGGHPCQSNACRCVNGGCWPH